MGNLSPSYLRRANRLLSLKGFSRCVPAIPIFQSDVKPDVDRQYVLRMMLRSDTLPLSIPPELNWIKDTIHKLIAYQESYGLNNPFIYFTVRHGIVDSVTDDHWHVDGFSLRFPHVPEQNYIFTDVCPTEILLNAWNISDDFDAMKHNLHTFFQERAEDGLVVRNEPGWVYAIDPYTVHRRPSVTQGTMRTFWRLSFVPIEIEDDTCTRNPLFPEKHYGREDIRKRLVAYR